MTIVRLPVPSMAGLNPLNGQTFWKYEIRRAQDGNLLCVDVRKERK